jgi:predicted nucleic acid-binding protein
VSDLPRFVPDASVILKWVLDADDEQDREAALELLETWKAGEIQLLVPPLWLYEVGNILCLKRPDDAEEILAALQELGLTEVSLDHDLVTDTVALAVGLAVTFYDATYLAVARHTEATLITADNRFLRKLPKDAAACPLGSLP